MITTVNGFRIDTDPEGTVWLMFDPTRAEECRQFALSNNIKWLMIYPGTYTASDLSPILPLKDQIEGITLYEKVDYAGLETFSKLTFLGMPDNKKSIISLSAFPNLEMLSAHYTERIRDLETCTNLRRLHFTNYKPKTKDLSGIPSLPLKYLGFTKTDIVSLKGIERFVNLQKLLIYSAPKLETLAPLRALSKNIEILDFEKCKKIADYQVLGELKALKRLRLSDSGQMESIAFVKKLPNLEHISFWGTNVLDGNIAYCEGIDFVGFDNKKHYSHKSEYFKKREKNRVPKLHGVL